MGFVALPVFGCLDIFELIVKYASDKNHIRNYKMTALHTASYKGNKKYANFSFTKLLKKDLKIIRA